MGPYLLFNAARKTLLRRAGPAARYGFAHDLAGLTGSGRAPRKPRTAGEELACWSAWTGGTRAAEAIEAFELKPLLDLEVRRLSAGQRRRLALARLVASPRPLWLLDEPLAPLDTGRRARFGALMQA